MRKNFYFLLSSVGLLLFASCTKSTVTPPVSKPINGVTINGTVYPTDTIASQIWLAVNYTGTGGYHVNFTDYDYDGYYYTQTQALALTLPSGWRVPSIADWNKMLSNFSTKTTDFANGSYSIQYPVALISTKVWIDPYVTHRGTNTSKFNILQTPYVNIVNGQPVAFKSQFTYFVTADKIGNNYSFQFSPDFEFIGVDEDPLNDAFSLRLVKDL